ncbi:hypothetical protein ELQ92_08065 [Labedella populi]|uniref:Uncharacterized protein n=1 Tax=Labedella populi TaxID=2498850 RepID=A0A444QDI9_9MICO|nr:hypothetical protein [Labedella populi]RWZ64682.1 hypothetical protein ELQ92_08065 [Labedella populi]
MAELHDPHGSADESTAKDPVNDSEGTPKPDGLGSEGTIPNDPDGIAAGHTGTASTFEPEEDQHAE